MYKVVLTNFGNVVYEGSNIDDAMATAVRTGFECTLTYNNTMKSWSPISGWRTLY